MLFNALSHPFTSFHASFFLTVTKATSIKDALDDDNHFSIDLIRVDRQPRLNVENSNEYFESLIEALCDSNRITPFTARLLRSAFQLRPIESRMEMINAMRNEYPLPGPL